MSKLRPLGYFPDKPDPRDFPFAAALRAGASYPSSYSLDDLVKSVGPLFQYDAGTCVMQVIAEGCRMVWEDRYALGKATPVLSRRAGYYVARSLSGNQHSDDGCMPRYAFQALDDMGWTTEDIVPYDEKLINDPIPVSAYQGMIDQDHVMRYKRVTDGEAAIEEFKAALSLQRRPIGFAIEVSPSFDQYEGGVWNAPDNAHSRGGHYLLATGYDDRKAAIRFVNSWPGYGIVEDGVSFGWISYDMFARRLVSDAYVFYPNSLPSNLNTNVIL